MTKLRHVFAIDVVVESPFIFPGAETHAVGVDTPALRDDDHRAVLPADHLKGLLLEAVQALKDKAPGALGGWDAGDLFGRERGNDRNTQSWEPARGRLLFADLFAEEDAKWRARPSSERVHTRIQIDDQSGAVAEGMLQEIELCAPFAARVKFTGAIIFHGTEKEGAAVKTLLTKALRLVPYFGGHRSIGFGRHVFEHSGITSGRSTPVIELSSREAPARRATYEATFDRPFLIASTATADNIFEGGTIVPGGAVKGAVADMLERAGLKPRDESELSRVLARLRVSHAFPIRDGVLLDRAIPLSIAAVPDSRAPANADRRYLFADAVSAPSGLIDGRCADFQADWKREVLEECRKVMNRPAAEDVASRPRVHTAIARETGTALEENLFVEVARGPRQGSEPLTVRFSIDFAEGDERTAAAEDIAAILARPLDAIGKTRAIMTPKLVGKTAPAPRAAGAGPWIVVLETAAAILDLDSEHAPRDGDRPTSAREQLEAYVAKAIPGARLADCFLRVRRAGGYHARRVKPYRPVTLFEPGSTLLIECAEGAEPGAVVATLRQFERSGLPVMRWTDTGGLRAVEDWRECAHLPQNGYGEISVDDAAFASVRAAMAS
jgi:hypothetical protein